MNDDFKGWLYRKVQSQVCECHEDCVGCPFNKQRKHSKVCNGLTLKQKKKILMKIYESEVDTK